MARLKIPQFPRKAYLSLLGLTGSLAILLMIGLGIYINKTKAETVATPNAFSTPTVLGEQFNEPPTALITKESGDVEYKLPNEEGYKRLEAQEERVPTGTSVKTGKKSLAHIVFPDNSLMSLSQNTEVVIDFEDKKIKVFQLLGNTWHRVQKVLQGHSYAVETPNTLATVRGTEFNVAVMANKRSEISVTESIVDVSKIEKKADGQMEVKETQRVEENKQVVVSENKSQSAQPLKVEIIPEDKKQTVWFQRNIEITEVIKKAEEEVKVSITPPSSEIEEVTPSTSETPFVISDEIKQIIIEKIMDSINENVELEKIDTNKVLEKNEEKMMDQFSETVMTSEKASEGEVQGASVVHEENSVTPEQQVEIGGRGADNTPTEEPTERVEPTEEPRATETEQPQPTIEENHEEPVVEEPTAEPTPWYQAPMEMIQNLFVTETPEETPFLE